MSEEVKAQIAAELAKLVQIVDFPEPPHGYGSDISGTDDLDPTMAEVDGFTTLALAQAIVRRLDCPRGGLPDDKDYGIDVRSYLNRGVTAQEIRELAGQIRAEVLEDDRVDTLTVTVRSNDVGSVLRIELAVQPVNVNLGPFTLTLNASDTGLVLEEIEAAL